MTTTPEGERRGRVGTAGEAGASTVQTPTGTRPTPTRRRPSLWSELPAWRSATPEQRRLIAGVVLDARVTCRTRRERVLAHPDIAARLVTDVGLRQPESWTGYVPPRIAWLDQDYTVHLNPSAVRTALLAILRAVAEREGV